MVVAVDMTGDRSLRDYDFEGGDDAVLDDPLIFLAQRDSLIVSADFAARHQLKVGSRLLLETALGDRSFTVRGVMKPKGMATAFGGSLAVMDVYAAQRMFARGRTFDRIDLAVAPGASIADAQRQIASALGPGFEVQPPASRAQQARTLVSGYRTVVNLSSAFALFIGMFIIHSSFATAVTQRRQEIGTLRAIGATRGQIRNLFLGEGVAMGALGSAIGVGVGAIVARTIGTAFAQLAADLYGVAQQPASSQFDFTVVLVAAIVGALTSIIATWLPARRACRVEPVEALQQLTMPASTMNHDWGRMAAFAALAAAATALLMFGRVRTLSYAGYA